MELTTKQKQYLKGLAHGRKPLVQVGIKGIGATLVQQIADQLVVHELIKIRFNTESAVEPAEAAMDLAKRTSSQVVQKKGRMLVLYRRRDRKPSILLPA